MSPTSPTRGHRGVSRARRMELTGELLARLDDPAEVRLELEDEIIRLNLVVATQEARRYERRGIDPEDLRQVACLALVKAVRRYDPALATDFLGYVVPCIRGELRRWFRDTGWVVRPPRSIQELQARVTRVSGELTQELGRSPRPSDIAARLGVPTERIEEAVSAHAGYSVDSLDATTEDSERPLAATLVHHEAGFSQVEARSVVAPLVRRLGAREQRILELRYLHDATQGEIGADIGVTQTQVSRLMTGINRQLRDELTPREDGAPGLSPAV
ncbi:sigma-70 family RNA polymerase sigma factor [Nocardioides sp. P5_C9_2]